MKLKNSLLHRLSNFKKFAKLKEERYDDSIFFYRSFLNKIMCLRYSDKLFNIMIHKLISAEFETLTFFRH